MLILLAGYDRCGKDSAYEAIAEVCAEQGIKFVKRIAQADHLKEVCSKVFGTTEGMKGTGAEEYYRKSLTAGSELMKIASGSDTYFSEYLMRTIGFENLVDPRKVYVCTDGRYDYEIDYFSSCGLGSCFFPIKLTRPSVPPTKYTLENHNFPEYRKFYAELINDSATVEGYKMVVKSLAESIIFSYSNCDSGE